MPLTPDAAAAEELSNVIRNRLREIPNLDIQHAIGGRLDAALLLPSTQRYHFLCEVLIDLDRSAPAPHGYPVPTGASELTRELLRLLALPDSQRDGDVARAILVQLERVLGEALADLARLVPARDLIHLRDKLVDAKKLSQHGTAALEMEIGHGRVSDAWVTTRLRAPRGVTKPSA